MKISWLLKGIPKYLDAKTTPTQSSILIEELKLFRNSMMKQCFSGGKIRSKMKSKRWKKRGK